MKIKYYLLSVLFILILICGCSELSEFKDSAPEEATPEEAWLQDFKRTMDPELGRPAPERLIPVLEQIRNYKLSETAPGDSTAPWTERGPYDVGGRTRAIMFDPNDANAKKVWVGGVTGGLWYNNDITSSGSEWQAADDFWDNLAVTCIAYDPNNSNTFYVGTGESFTSASRGAGIWKSTDGGATWSQLSSTSSFYYVNDIVVRNESGSSVVYAGVTGRYYEGSFHGSAQAGLQRSTNGGSSWSQVLPNIPGESYPAAASDIELDAGNNLWIGTDASPYGLTDRGGGRIYTSGNGTSYTLSYTASVTNGYGRVELACAPSDADYVYAIIEDVSTVEAIVKTTNGGSSWSSVSEPSETDTGIPSTDFSNGQAGYDLIAAVHPTDRDQVIVGGIDLFRSTNGGTSWTQISKWSNNNNLAALSCPLVHADQHQIVFRPGYNNEVVFGNDGGVFYCTDITSAASSNVIQQRNNAYNVTQFYATAIHPEEGKSFYLAGSQDNGTQLFNKFGMGSTLEASGGDGAFCFIDADEPDTMITSYVYNNYYASYDGGTSFSSILSSSTGSFINPADYDDNLNILYSAYSSSAIVRLPIGSSVGTVSISLGDMASAFTVSPHTTASTTLFIGTEGGKVFKVADANTTPSATDISGGSFPSGAVSCIEIGGSEDTLVATFFNYGVTSIWYTTNGGSSWVSKEGNLPDMPVRWFLFNPNNKDEAIVATELGVWSTSDFSSGSPSWAPSTSGLANVRVDMLQMRNSDKQVVAATHGRGLFSSDAFADKAPVADFRANTERAGVEMPVKFTDQSSSNPTSWSWSFSPNSVVYLEGTSSSSQNPVVQFTATGNYQVSLTSTNTFGSDIETKSSYISIASATAIPYSQNFDGFTSCATTSGCNVSCTLSSDWLNASNTETDNDDWRVDAGGTPSSDTGPNGDNTSGSGNYLYIEASNCSDKEMILYSPVFDLRSVENPSLNFAYHMYGVYINQLELSVYNQGEWEVLWDLHGNSGNSWSTATIDLSAYSDKQVVFQLKGSTGFDFHGDIAIDDFSLSESGIYWDNGGVTNNWSEAANWSTDEVPGTGAHVTLDNTHVSGSYTVNLNSAQQISSLAVDAGANTISLSGGNALNITGVVYPVSGILASNGQLTLKAVSEIQYGQVDTGSGSISGNVVNEWYYDGPSGYRHIASPVSCNLSEITTDFSRLVFSTGNDGSIWSWDPDTSYWNTPSGSSDPFDQAFSVFMGTSYGEEFSPLPFIFNASGTLNTGNQPQTLIYSVGDPGDFVDPGENAGWNFMHNPYPSVLDWEAIVADAGFPAELSATVYYWDESIDAYASFNANTSTSVNGGTGQIAKGQSVWVQLSSSPGGGSTTLSLTDAMRSTESTPKAKQAPTLLSKTRIRAAQGKLADRVYFARFEKATGGYDHRFDHLEMDNGLNGLSICSDTENRQLAYNCLEQYHYPIPFSVLSASDGIIRLSFEIDDLFEGEEPRFVKDLSTGVVHRISDGDYSFAGEGGVSRSFLLMHRKDDDRTDRPEVTVGTERGRLTLLFRDYGSFDKVYLFDLSGKLILMEKLDVLSRESELTVNETGVFVLHLSGPSGKRYSQKVAVLK